MPGAPRGTIAEYITALKGSEKFGPQVVAHHVFPEHAAQITPPTILSPELGRVLHDMGITSLYSHQQEALSSLFSKQNVIVATPTASGKSLIYNLPILQAYANDRRSKALYLFPLKALAQDQLKNLEILWQQLPEKHRPPRAGAIFDGDTSAYQRKKIRDVPPPILITNPDMLHLSLLPYHDKWGHFWANLQYIVIDEVHTYRGVFGSHVSWVLRRLQRICELYGARPEYILTSATIGNPEEHARSLINQASKAIPHSGAGRAARHFILLNPLESAASSATLLLEAAVSRGLRTIVYCQSRKMTELITIWTEKRLKDKAQQIASYRSGFLPEQRREIEQQLADGTLLGVISTSALELGIDIGNLDLCLLVGFPGSMMATWQRSGRVGRAQQESLVILLGHEDALDQHFMRHPTDFFTRAIEPVCLYPANPYIAGPHLVCAAAESPLGHDEAILHSCNASEILKELCATGALLQSADGKTYFSPRHYPQREINLRGGGKPLSIFTSNPRALLGEIDTHRALHDCHPGAIYLHRAKTYHVDRLDLETLEIQVSPAHPPYFTRAITTKETEILAVQSTQMWGQARIHFGRLKVTESITGYQQIAQGSMKILARLPLKLPPQIFETEGFWLEFPDDLHRQLELRHLHFMGGIHALEHALIGLMPLTVLCDRNDLGGISHPWHEQIRGSAVFIYDGYAGGIGLCRRAFEHIDALLQQTLQAVRECSCALGCPSCIHSPKCGSGNRPLDKQACLFLLQQLEHKTQRYPSRIPLDLKQRQGLQPVPPQPIPDNFGVFDIETQKSAQEVGGWHRADKMRVSIAVLYEHQTKKFTTFTESTVTELIQRLSALDLVVGFNNKRFDNKVLSRYTRQDLGLFPSFDILEAITNQLGYRLSLDRLAENTLNAYKEGDGLDALRWFKNGQFDLLERYCRQDVEITLRLFQFGLEHHHLLFRNKAGKQVRLPVSFGQTIGTLLERRAQILKARQDFCESTRSDQGGRF